MFFLAQDIVLVGIGAAGYLAGGAAIANYADSWSEFANVDSPFQNTVRRVATATGAAAVSIYTVGRILIARF